MSADNNNTNSNETPEPEKKIDYQNTLFKVDLDTVEMIRDMVMAHHRETGGGLSAPDLAERMCGDKKHASNITFAVKKYLDGVIESRQGCGLVPFGAEAMKGTRLIAAPAPEYTEQVHVLLDQILSQPGIRKFSVKGLVKQALRADMTGEYALKFLGDQNAEGDDDESTFRAALNMLTHSEDSPFEISAGDVKKRAPKFDPLKATNKIPKRPGQK